MSDGLERHQCMIYEGPPSRTLGALIAAFKPRLAAGLRCMYFNSPAMVAGLRSQMFAAGIDVDRELARGSIQLSSDTSHLVDGRFDVGRMIAMLDEAVGQATADGYAGLFACGDMTWEFGPEKDFEKLVEYEWELEQLFRKHATLSGACQYHRDLLPADAIRDAAVSHSSAFINATMSRVNPHYIAARTHHDRAKRQPLLTEALAMLLATT